MSETYQEQIDKLYDKVEYELKQVNIDCDRMKDVIELLMNKITYRPSHRTFRKDCKENLNLQWYYDHRIKFSEVEVDFKQKFMKNKANFF